MHHEHFRSPRNWNQSPLKFELHVVDNLIPTLIGSVTAGQCLAKVEPDKQFERPALDDIRSSTIESFNFARASRARFAQLYKTGEPAIANSVCACRKLLKVLTS